MRAFRPLSFFIFILSFPLWTPLALAQFSDVPPAHPHHDAIQYAQTQGIVQGYPDGTFRPAQKVTRAELVKMLSSKPEALPAHCFTDVHEEWFAPYICAAKVAGIVSGYADGSFHPNDPVSFAEAAKIIDTALTPSGLDPFSGPYWYREYVYHLAEARAVPLTIHSLSQPVTRGEIAEITYRIKSTIQLPAGASRSFEELVPLFAMLRSQFHPRANNYFAIFATFEDKASAQKAAESLWQGWVLDTSLTSNLSPGYFAVVDGPFSSREQAQEGLQEALPLLAGSPTPYVKDAGAFVWPAGYPFDQEDYPPGVLQALLGDVDLETLRGASIRTRWDINGCQHAVSYSFFLTDANGEPLRGDAVDLGFSGEYEPFRGTWLLEETGELRRPIACLWD